MLSFNEIDSIITENLDSLNPNSYQVSREHRGQSILYTVTKLGKLLGRYRVIKKTDGNIYYGPIQGDGPEWNLLWESMLHRLIIRADGKITETLEQAYQERFNLYMKQMQEIASNESRPTINTMVEQTKKLSTMMPAKLEKPQKPEFGSGIHVWFDYYHAMNNAGYKMTFPMLADESGYSKNTFKVEHGRYKLERGL